MIRRWLGKCEAWDPSYCAVRCILRYGHDGGHRFGILHTPYLSIDLDEPVELAEIPEPFAEPPPPKGPAGVSTHICCCRCHRESP
jgi:hypothetical protein